MKRITDRLAGIATIPGTRRAAAAVRAWLAAAGARSDFRIFAIVFLLLLSFRILLVVTYPLNIAHDSDNYLNMILGQGSSLVHAAGYPFLINVLFLWHRFPGPTDPTFLYSLQIAQHAIELLTLVALFFCLADIFNNWVAGLAVVIIGMDIDAAAFTNASTPEWLQADLLVLSFCAAYRGLVARRDVRKTVFYALSLAAYVASFLVKFNSLPFGLFFIPLFLAEKSARRRWISLGAALSGIAVYASFLVTYHYPSTGTLDLTADKGWVLMPKLQWSLAGKIHWNHMGINTRRLVALNGALPHPTSSEAFPAYFNVNAVPPETRRPYRDKYLWLLTADRRTLDAFMNTYSYPKEINFEWAFLPVSYYIGLSESDSLCVKAFLETVARQLSNYSRNNVNYTFEMLSNYPQHTGESFETMLPIAGNTIRTPKGVLDTRQVLKEKEDLGNGFVRYVTDATDQWAYPYLSPRPVLWKPGEPWIALDAQIGLPHGVLFLVMGLLYLQFIRFFMKEGFTVKSSLILFLLAAIPGFMAYSCFTYVFRDKELRFLWPMVGMAQAIAIAALCEVGHYLYRHARARMK